MPRLASNSARCGPTPLIMRTSVERDRGMDGQLVSRPLLLLERFAKGVFAIGYVTLVAVPVDKGIAGGTSEAGELSFHVVVAAVRAKKNIARKRFQNTESLLIVGSDLRVGNIVDQLVTGVYVRTANDHDI